jgi:hypothetical protein
VERVLREAEEQAAVLKRLELEVGRSREYLSKVRLSASEMLYLG